jgi:tetratricopeptide (TPR) repeat protein
MSVTLLVLVSCVSAWQAVRATRAERQAVAERDRAEQEKNRAEASFKMARETVDRFFTQVGDSPQLKAQGMEKFRKDMLQNANEFYERFIREHLDAPEVRRDLGLAYCRLAKIHGVLGEYAAAQTSSEKAINILGELALANKGAAEYQRDLAAAHFGLGVVYFDTGRLDMAEKAYQQALVIQERLVADHGEVAEYRRALATTQNGLGFLRYRAGQYQKAQVSLEQALAAWNQVVGHGADTPEDMHGLASVQQRLGATHAERGESQKAEAMVKGAVSTYQTLVHDHPDVPDYRHSLARAYMALGGLYLNNLRKADKAEAAFEQALRIFEKLAQEHPDVLEYVYEQGHCYEALAMDAQLGGRLDTALTRGEKATEILERVVSRGYSQARGDLVDSRIGHATVLAARGDHARAVDEVNVVAQQDNLKPANLYNITCTFALSSAAAEKDAKLAAADRIRLKAQYTDRAMEFLRQAVAKGFQDTASLKNDPDLACLRSREDFQKLLQEAERKSAR